jgi:2'-5' RNA ligase
MKKRLFLAAKLPEKLLDFLDNVRKNNDKIERVRWVPRENRHLTLCFLGNVEINDYQILVQAIQSVVETQSAFNLRWEGFTLAPPNKPAKMIWGKCEEKPVWFQLVDDLRKASKPFSSESLFQRKQYPHITLARWKDPKLAKMINLEKPQQLETPVPINSCYLFESVLSPSGPEYSVLETFYFSD